VVGGLHPRLPTSLFPIPSRFAGALLRPSLTVLLPVRNSQSSLAGTVHKVLEVLSDLTNRFELVIIDDGSTDATIEVADDLATCYPQVTAVRHARPMGRSTAVRTGLRRSTGEVVLVRDNDCRLPIEEIPRLWWAMTDPDQQIPGLVGVSGGKAPSHKEPPDLAARGGFQMFLRRAVERVEETAAEEAGRSDPGRPAASRPKRPNYLARLREFAFGE
jgi:glycosyltransferase involved in cell wall biosynthesis